MTKNSKAKPAPDRIGINVTVPASIHRAARIACVQRQVSWHEAVAAALDAWVRQPVTK